MNKQEFSKIAMAIRTYYPNQNIMPNQQAMELWFVQLQDIPYKVCMSVVNKWVALNKWAPTIADIREGSVEIAEGGKKDWSEAWEEVLFNIREYGFHRAEDGLERLTGITRQAVERIGYTRLCHSENITADRANFRDIYNELSRREAQEKQIPRQLLEHINNIRMIGMKGEKE